METERGTLSVAMATAGDIFRLTVSGKVLMTCTQMNKWRVQWHLVVSLQAATKQENLQLKYELVFDLSTLGHCRNMTAQD